MNGEALASGAVIGMLGLAIVAVLRLIVHARANPPVPPRPELLRERFADMERLPTRGARAANWIIGLSFAVPGALLALLAQDSFMRFVGAGLVAWVALAALLSIRARTNGKLEAVAAKALAQSEAFWSQPDAEERARARRRAPFGRVAG